MIITYCTKKESNPQSTYLKSLVVNDDDTQLDYDPNPSKYKNIKLNNTNKLN